jgi:hypothetical protein
MKKTCRHVQLRVPCDCAWYADKKVNGRRVYTNLGRHYDTASRLYEQMTGKKAPPQSYGLRVGRSGFVYLIRRGKLTKIGFTTNPWARMQDLMNAGGITFKLVGIYMGRQDLETALHREFADCRHNGEWFALPRGWQARMRRVMEANPLIISGKTLG